MQPTTPGVEEVLIRNAKILTQQSHIPVASSVRIRGNRIVEVAASDLPANGARVIDARGATVLPGFNDVHAHSVWFGLTQLELDLSDVSDVERLYELVTAEANATADGEWVIASGFNHILLGCYPDRDRLDEAAGGRPVWLKHNSGHAAFVNGAALTLIAENADLAEPIEGGVIVRDATGRPTGLLEENAMELVQSILLPYPVERIVEALEAATRRYVSEGITSVTDAGIGGGWIGHSMREFSAYQLAHARGVLHTRMQPMFVIDALHDVPGHESEAAQLGLDGGIHTGLGNDRLQLGPVKIFSDGSLLGSTAAVTEHYHECPGNHGYLQESPETLRDRALRAYAGGWSIAMHAIGDYAVDQAISIIGEAQERWGKRAVPNRIEHAGIVRDEQLAQIAQLGIAVTPQPFFLHEFGDAMAERVGEARESQLYRARSFLDHGIMLPGSSDRPVAGGNPLSGIRSYVERRSNSGRVIGADERITAAEAVAAYTIGSAKATGQADSRGSVEAGKLADLVILSDDPTNVVSTEIDRIEVIATMVDGVFVYGAERLTALQAAAPTGV